jgi:predicted  nucleic acid-binding Zn-ribbon protein
MFTLTWGNQESGASSDIDSHLVGPKADGQGKFHVYYGDATYSVNGETYADLDYDDTEWEGPEHVTVYEQTDGVYSFYVHNYSEGDSKYDNMTMMAKSGIQVRITLGTASYTYNCPNQTGNLWYVCDYNSVTHTIIPKNIMYDYSGDTSNIGMKDTDRIINIIESAEELLNEYEQTEARTAIAKKLAALKEKAAAVTDEADTSALYDEASRIKTDITELNYIRSKIDYYEEDEVPVALDAKVTSLENKLAEAETTDAYDSLGEEIDLIYGALYRIDEIRTLIPEFDANEELTTLGERVNKLEEQILAASEDSEYDVISEEVAKIYAPLSSGYSIAVVKYEGVIEYGYESGGVATDDAYNVIGARYIIERNENASNQDVLDNLKFTTENDVSYTITQLADNDKYQALVKVTNSTTGYVKNVYVTIYEY